jgi:hypothetical protein
MIPQIVMSLLMLMSLVMKSPDINADAKQVINDKIILMIVQNMPVEESMGVPATEITITEATDSLKEIVAEAPMIEVPKVEVMAEPIVQEPQPPTCNLTITDIGENKGEVSWVSTNATTGKLMADYHKGNYKKISPLLDINAKGFPIDNGSMHGFYIYNGFDIYGTFTGPNGSVDCEASISAK